MRNVRADGPVRFAVVCLDRRTGKTVWQKVAREEIPHEGHHRDHGFASQSPVTDGQLLFTFFGSHGLYCFDLNGNLKWSKQLGRMTTRNGFGEGASPALAGDMLVVAWDHEGDDFVAAFDKRTGKERWRKVRDEPTGWSTPLVVRHAGKNQVVLSNTNRIRSYDAATGNQVWECAGMTANAIPSPVSGNGMLYATSGFRGNSLLAIKLGRTGDLSGTDAIAWSHNRGTPYVPSPLLTGPRLYFFGGNDAILTSVDAKSGQKLIDGQRIQGLRGVYASPVSAAGKVYLVGRNGTTVVIKDAPSLQVLATNELAEPMDASPAVAGNELYLRGHQSLYCVATR
jgi:outer membrane protein assembly factor BamB